MTTAGIKAYLNLSKKKNKLNLDAISRFNEMEWLTGITKHEGVDVNIF